MFKVPLVTSATHVSENAFWKSVFLYHNSPHLVNRRVLGISQLFILEINLNTETYRLTDLLKYSELYSQVYRLKTISSDNINESVVLNILEQYGNIFSYKIKLLDEVEKSEEGVFVSVRILLPRCNKIQPCLEFVILDKANNIASFLAISDKKPNLGPNFRYDIELEKSNLMKICVTDIETAEDSACEWLVDVLFSKLISWTAEKAVSTPVQKSLSLVAVEKYCLLYHKLKLKYAENIRKNWTENTDPIKFIHEDIAISTYLIILWEQYSEKRQNFVDLGCGNGLLVYILSQEGHSGYGIDIRDRKIWKTYPDSVKLKVQTITPSTETVYPEADWIIGNHSDELTPWIPVIAARSSKNCKYFLLPCCSYEFNGKKYQRNDSSKSTYQEYLQYVKCISDMCGFKTEMDRLRIPSTKRICLVGAQRCDEELDVITIRIKSFINLRCKTDETEKLISNFEARPAEQPARNCTKLNKDFCLSIISKIFFYLLSEKNDVVVECERKWNKGKIVDIPTLIKLVAQEDLKKLKNMCGGFQTLLKNNHYIFFVKNGTVQIRKPQARKLDREKTQKCWFFQYHPDGCPLNVDSCSYLH